MMGQWWILTSYLGIETKSPNLQDVENAIEELNLVERNSEQGSVSLRYGDQSGCMYVLDYYPYGDLIFTKYVGQDFGKMQYEHRCPSIRFGLMPLTKAFAVLLDGSPESILKMYD